MSEQELLEKISQLEADKAKLHAHIEQLENMSKYGQLTPAELDDEIFKRLIAAAVADNEMRRRILIALA